MKKDFILEFVKGVVGFGKNFLEVYSWTPVYYKGFLVKGHAYKKLYAGVKNLEHRKIIKKVKDGEYVFTDKGRVWFRGTLFKYYRDLNFKWDGKWRVVIFDVPQDLHNKRNSLRKKLNSWGFHMIQKSVFVFPFPCEEELSIYCADLDISEYVNVIVAQDIGFIENDVKKFFNL